MESPQGTVTPPLPRRASSGKLQMRARVRGQDLAGASSPTQSSTPSKQPVPSSEQPQTPSCGGIPRRRTSGSSSTSRRGSFPELGDGGSAFLTIHALQILEDVRINLERLVPPLETECLAFRVLGPPSLVNVLEQCECRTLTLSPAAKLTLASDDRLPSGVPREADTFAFAYPMLSEQWTEMVCDSVEGALADFLLLGGFVYFDDVGNVLQCNAISAKENASKRLQLDGPHAASEHARLAMEQQGRLFPVTHMALRDAGYLRFGWVNPSECPGGHKLEDCDAGEAEEEGYPHGAFLYEYLASGDRKDVSHSEPKLFRVERPGEGADAHARWKKMRRIFGDKAAWRRIVSKSQVRGQD